MLTYVLVIHNDLTGKTWLTRIEASSALDATRTFRRLYYMAWQNTVVSVFLDGGQNA